MKEPITEEEEFKAAKIAFILEMIELVYFYNDGVCMFGMCVCGWGRCKVRLPLD